MKLFIAVLTFTYLLNVSSKYIAPNQLMKLSSQEGLHVVQQSSEFSDLELDQALYQQTHRINELTRREIAASLGSGPIPFPETRSSSDESRSNPRLMITREDWENLVPLFKSIMDNQFK